MRQGGGTIERDETTEAVLAAFDAARAAGKPPVECYRAGVLVWQQRHPEQAPSYAAKRAVGAILAASPGLRDRE